MTFVTINDVHFRLVASNDPCPSTKICSKYVKATVVYYSFDPDSGKANNMYSCSYEYISFDFSDNISSEIAGRSIWPTDILDDLFIERINRASLNIKKIFLDYIL